MGLAIYVFLETAVPSLSFVTHLQEDSLCTRKTLYNSFQMFWTIGYIFFALAPWLFNDKTVFFGGSIDTMEKMTELWVPCFTVATFGMVL